MKRTLVAYSVALAVGITALLQQFGQSLWSIVVVLAIILFIHEGGHFLAAKAFDIRVPIFSFGFGRRLAGFRWGDTDCRLSAIPLGGYVMLEDAADPEGAPAEGADPAHDRRKLSSRPRWQRSLVYLAGPVMNGALTVALMTGLYMVGWQVDASRYERPVVGAVLPGMGAESAGLEPGDEIVAIDGKTISNWEQLQFAVLLRPNATLTLRVRRDSNDLDLAVRSSASGPEGVGDIGIAPLVRVGRAVPGQPAELAGIRRDDAILRINDQPVAAFSEIPGLIARSQGGSLTLRLLREGKPFEVSVTPRDGRIGIESKTMVRRFGPVAALVEALRFTRDQTRNTFVTIQGLVTARLSPRLLQGPLGIARVSGEIAQLGVMPLLALVAFLSLQVGIFNLLPVSPLDGGNILILAGEGLARRDFNERLKIRVAITGWVLLGCLFIFVTFSDLSRLLPFSRSPR